MKLVRNVTLGAAAALALTASTSFAQGMFTLPNGTYAGLEGGILIPNGGIKTTGRNTVNGTTNTVTTNGNLNLSSGPVLGAFLGYNINKWLAVEGNFDYAHMDLRNLEGTSTAATAAGTVLATTSNAGLKGSVNTYTGLANLIVHPFGTDWNWHGLSPFIGGGIGVSHWDGSVSSISIAGSNFSASSKGSDTNLAADGLVGVDFAVAPAVTIGARYKFLYVDTGHSATGGGIATTNDSFLGHMITANLTYHFGVPTPPPPPPVAAPPAPPPAAAAPAKRTFIVFFEFDKSNLTPDGGKVVDAAAAAFQRGETVAVAGYTDAAGTVQYNLALSKRRADTVKAALVKDGVPASAIDESWHGKADQRVPTADGVREPQNRRVEINM